MFSLSGIKNLVFDLGNVLLNIDHTLSFRQFERHTGLQYQQLIEILDGSGIFKQLDTGFCNEAYFHDQIREIIGLNISDADIDNAWNAMLLDFPAQRVELLLKLKKHYRVFLLSNTDSIHFRFYTENFRQQYGFEMGSLFEHMYLSFEMHDRKPNAPIFRTVEKQSGLKAAEIAFFDDMPANICAAVQLGWNAVQIISGKNEVSNVFKTFI